MAKNNAELVYQIEDMIKKYNKKPEKKIKKKDIVNLLEKAQIIMTVKSDFSVADVYDEIISGVALKPDIVKDGTRARLLPVFTSYDQIPSDYMETFFAFCYNINSAGNSAVNVEFKGGFYYGIQDIWCLFQRHFI